jgi:hypothetical protein
MVPGLNQAMFGTNEYLAGVGADRQAYDQSVIEGNVLQDYQRQTMWRDAVTDYLNLISSTAAPYSSQTATAKKKPGLLDFLALAVGAA